LLGSATTAPYSVGYDTTTIANGSHTFTCKAYDTAGHSTSSSANTVTVNNVVQTAGPWAKRFGGTGSDYGTTVAVDGTGNVYVAGYFQGSADFGGGVLTSAGGVDLFLAKYTAAGAHLWSKRFGGTGDEQVSSIVLDASGNIFLAGKFTGTGNFGGSSFTSAGQQDGYLAKYSPQGEPLWSQSFGGVYGDVVNKIAVDSQGNIAVTGVFRGTVVIGGTTLTSWGQSDAFLAKFSATGAGLWAKNFVNQDYDYGTAVVVDKRDDSILLAGYFQASMNLGGGSFTTPGGYLAKFSPSGTLVWSRTCGTGNPARIWAMALDSNGDVTISGDFNGQTDLGGGVIRGTSLLTDMFVAKYSSVDGSYRWSRAINGTYLAQPTSMTVDAQNNIILTGFYQGTCNFGAQSFSTTAAFTDGFVAKYSSAGAPIWAQGFGGDGTSFVGDCGMSVTVDSTSHPILTGCFTGTTSLAGQSVTSLGPLDVVISRLNP
jgi:hypothetical protein